MEAHSSRCRSLPMAQTLAERIGFRPDVLSRGIRHAPSQAF
jgi:hypothetical protein